MEEQRAFETSIAISPSGLPEQGMTQESLIGYRFISSDSKQVAQFRVDGFTFNRLAPYTAWNEIVPQVFELWGHYTRTAQPQMIVRVCSGSAETDL